MAVGQSSGSGAMTNLNDDKVRKDDILSNRDKAQRRPGQSLDGTGVQVAEYKNVPTNQRPASDEASRGGVPETITTEETEAGDDAEKAEKTDRPGFDLGGSTGDTSAGRGLGLGTDAKEDREGWKLPRGKQG